MGLFPFASTVGTMWYSSLVTARACGGDGAWRPATMPERWAVNVQHRSPSSLPFRQPHSTSSLAPSSLASCLSPARCPDTAARPAAIRGGVSRRTSGQTPSRSERGDHAMAERGPPSPPRPSC